MKTKYNIGEEIWVPIYKNYRKCKVFEVVPIRNCFWGDSCLLAHPYKFFIVSIKMSCKGIKYAIKVNQSNLCRKYDIKEYLIWISEDDIFDSKEELEEEYEMQKANYIKNWTAWTPYNYECNDCCNCCCKCCYSCK